MSYVLWLYYEIKNVYQHCQQKCKIISVDFHFMLFLFHLTPLVWVYISNINKNDLINVFWA